MYRAITSAPWQRSRFFWQFERMCNKHPDALTVEKLRFSLRHLLVVLGVACVVLMPSYYFGGIYLFSIAFSLALVFTCAMVYRATAVGTVVIALVGLLVGFPLAMVFLTFLVHAFFNLVACIVLALTRVRVRVFATALCLTLFAVYAFAVYSGLAEM